MEFSPNNPVVRLCLQGSMLAEKGEAEEADRVLLQAWNEAESEFERLIAAWFLGRQQGDASLGLEWFERALQCANRLEDFAARSTLPSLHSHIARCHELLSDVEKASAHRELAAASKEEPADEGPFFHGTKADLRAGDLLTPGGKSNYDDQLRMNHIYFTALVNGAGLAAALAQGEGAERVYAVEPMGAFEHDPNVTDKKFPGNPTRSYRSPFPLRIIGEVGDWTKQTPEDLQRWREKLANTKGKIIN